MNKATRPPRVMAFGVGGYVYGMLQIIKEHGAEVSTYLTRDYAHFPPSLVGPTFHSEVHPNPCALLLPEDWDGKAPLRQQPSPTPAASGGTGEGESL